jgi:sulfide dehydrogenase cytochrome subunit
LTDVPTIAGISALALEDALYAYREGDRVCPTASHPTGDETRPRMDMCVHANGLAEEDVAGAANYYAALPFVPAEQQTDAAKAEQGKAIHDRDCEICHSEGGSDPADDASILAGQHTGYLRQALTEYQAAARPQPRPMEAKVTALSAADIDALVNFYGSQQ